MVCPNPDNGPLIYVTPASEPLNTSGMSYVTFECSPSETTSTMTVRLYTEGYAEPWPKTEPESKRSWLARWLSWLWVRK